MNALNFNGKINNTLFSRSNVDDKTGLIIHYLKNNETSILESIYEEMLFSLEHFQQDEILCIAKFFRFQLKKKVERLYDEIYSLKNTTLPTGLYIKGLPKLSYTQKHIRLGELISLTFSLILGEPFQFKQQNEGKLVAHICPKSGSESESSQSGYSRNNFGWHTDDRYFQEEFRTKWIQLLGVHNPSSARTLIAPIDKIIEHLSNEEINILMQRKFEVKMPTSFGFCGNIWSQGINILWKNKENLFEVGVPTYHVRTKNIADETAKEALSKFIHSIDPCESSIVIDSSSLLIFNNNRILHGRSPFVGDRLILRTYIRDSLLDLRRKTNTTGNVFDARLLV